MKYTKLYAIAEKLEEKGLEFEIRYGKYQHPPCAIMVEHDYYGIAPDVEAWAKMDMIDSVCKKYKGVATKRRGYYQGTMIYLADENED